MSKNECPEKSQFRKMNDRIHRIIVNFLTCFVQLNFFFITEFDFIFFLYIYTIIWIRQFVFHIFHESLIIDAIFCTTFTQFYDNIN